MGDKSMLAPFLLCLGISASAQTPTNLEIATSARPLPAFGSCGFGVSPELLASVSKIKLDHSLTKEEATVLANAYRECNWGGCGANSEPIDRQSEWIVNLRVGYGAEPAPAIIINKVTGKISCAGSKTFNTLAEFENHLQTPTKP